MLIGVRQRRQPRPWLCTWHTTHRSIDDRTAPARCVYPAVPGDTSQKSTLQLRQLIRSLTYRFRHWYRHHSSAVYCHPGPRCRHRRPRLNGSHVLSIFSEPTAWLTARRNCSRVYAWLSNLCKHIFMLPISLCVCRLSS